MLRGSNDDLLNSLFNSGESLSLSPNLKRFRFQDMMHSDQQ
jgi:hypothetical protein